VLEAVDLAGASERTVTFFFPDHGEYLGDHGLVEKWPSGQHDALLRNPLVVAGPGVAEGVVVDSMVELVDLLPTCLELAGTEARHTHFGRSLVPLLAGRHDRHRDLAFSEGGFLVSEEHLLERSPAPYAIKSAIQHEDPVTVGRVVSVRDQRWTYVHRLYEGPELYDRQTDPHETVNLAGRPDSVDVEVRLRDEVLHWLLETVDVLPWEPDPRFEPELTELVTRQVRARKAAAGGQEP
jgi:arylsulfatase A-like enzyme